MDDDDNTVILIDSNTQILKRILPTLILSVIWPLSWPLFPSLKCIIGGAIYQNTLAVLRLTGSHCIPKNRIIRTVFSVRRWNILFYKFMILKSTILLCGVTFPVCSHPCINMHLKYNYYLNKSQTVLSWISFMSGIIQYHTSKI